MDLNTNLDVINLFNDFKKNKLQEIEEDLANKFIGNDKELCKVIDYLRDNTIEIDDINIQILLSHFLQYQATLENKDFIFKLLQNDANVETLTLQFTKLVLSILHKIKNSEITLKDIRYRKIPEEKKFLTRQEFANKYGYSITWQDGKKGRLNDPIPFIQLGGFRHKIIYNVDNVEKWMENNHISF